MGGVAGIELPEGNPGAVESAAALLTRAAGAFDSAAGTVSQAEGQVGLWRGFASFTFRDHCGTNGEAARAGADACQKAATVLRRYGRELEDARQRVRELQRKGEECVRRMEAADARAGAAAESAAGAELRGFLAAAAGGPDAAAATAAAERDADVARAEQAQAQREAEAAREELDRLRERAEQERDRIKQRARAAAGSVRGAAGMLPGVQYPGGPASPSLFGGTPFGPPLSPLTTDPRWATAMSRAAAHDTEEEEEEEDNGGNIGDFLSGGINELSFGKIDLGGDKDSDAYTAGRVVSYVPWNPASAVKSVGTGIIKGGTKLAARGADDAAEAGARRGAAAARPPAERKFWKSSTDFEGHRVHQRDDLIDPNVVDKRGRTNLTRMKKGLAPLGPDGKPINLHHLTQQNGGSLAEVAQAFHQKHHGALHINTRDIPSGIDRRAFNALRRRYWKARADDFGGVFDRPATDLQLVP